MLFGVVGSGIVVVVVVVVVVVAATTGGVDLPSQCRKCVEMPTLQRVFYAGASSNQRCKTSDILNAKQSPSRGQRAFEDQLDRFLVGGSILDLGD